MAGQDDNTLDRVAVAGRKDFPRAPGPRVPLALITDAGRGAVIRVESALPFPLDGELYQASSARTVLFRQHLIIFVMACELASKKGSEIRSKRATIATSRTSLVGRDIRE